MSNARMAVLFARAMAKDKFPDDVVGMEKYCLEWLGAIDNATDAGSHKYIPTDRLNAELGLPDGAGVYGYRSYPDGSYVLLTCRDGLAVWDGGDSPPSLDRD